MFDGLLTVPYELILTQSFSFLSKSDAKTVMGRKQNQMVSAGDKAGSQLEELDDALDDLESNRFVLGDHHLTLTVFADSVKELTDNLAKSRTHLTNGGAVVAREDIGLEAAWWAQLSPTCKPASRSKAHFSRLISCACKACRWCSRRRPRSRISARRKTGASVSTR